MNIDKLIQNSKFLIFDFDGTIADTSHLHENAFKKVFKPFCIKINYKEIAGNLLIKSNYFFTTGSLILEGYRTE